MTLPRLFLAHEALETWIADGRAEVNAEELKDKETGRRFALREALRFIEELTDGEDPHELVGRVKDMKQVADLGGEHMADSVILGEKAYRVQPGFMGILLDVPDEKSETRPAKRPPQKTPEPGQSQTIAALQKFFLNNVK